MILSQLEVQNQHENLNEVCQVRAEITRNHIPNFGDVGWLIHTSLFLCEMEPYLKFSGLFMPFKWSHT